MTVNETEIMNRLASVDGTLMTIHATLSFYETHPETRNGVLMDLEFNRAAWGALKDRYASRVMPSIRKTLEAVKPVFSRARNLVVDHKEAAARVKIAEGRQRLADLFQLAVIDTGWAEPAP